ncbi:retrotransposon protein, putative, ty1-copia subclass, partial [Tanacetum coccineum]
CGGGGGLGGGSHGEGGGEHNLDSTYLWHCRLAHISKKRIEKLQHDGLLKSMDEESFDKSVSCLSGKMARKPFPHRTERATDLLGIIHTDVCGPLRHVSRHKVWGCEALVKRDTPDKLQQRSIKYIFIGYPKETMDYYFYFPPENKIVVARSARTHQAPDRLCLNVEVEKHSLGDLNEPNNYKAALLDPESNKWVNAINAKMQSMKDNQVWCLVDLPANCKTIGSKWLFKKKTDMDGIKLADIRAIRILIAIEVFYDYEIWQMDVKTAFLNGYLNEYIYIVQPEGFVDPNHPRKASGSNVTFLILYVDDIIIMGNHIPSLQSVKDYLGKFVAMKDLGEATFILGIKIYRDRSRRLIGLGQNAYMDKILKRYRMDNSKRGHIPIQERLDLNKTQGASTPEEVKRMKNVPYASAMGSIIYVVRCTRPDVAFAQNITSRFQQNPGESHWTVMKNILKYLENTIDLFLVVWWKFRVETIVLIVIAMVGFEDRIDD